MLDQREETDPSSSLLFSSHRDDDEKNEKTTHRVVLSQWLFEFSIFKSVGVIVFRAVVPRRTSLHDGDTQRGLLERLHCL